MFKRRFKSKKDVSKPKTEKTKKPKTKKNEKPKEAKNRYHNKKVIIDGIKFDSGIEGDYYLYLKGLKKRKKIKDFTCHPKYILQKAFKKNGKTIRAITYSADFRVIYNDDSTVNIDIKGGVLTDHFKIKRKMFDYMYPNETLILITRRVIDDEKQWIDFDEYLLERSKAKKLKKKIEKEKEKSA